MYKGKYIISKFLTNPNSIETMIKIMFYPDNHQVSTKAY